MSPDLYTIFPLGDSAITVDFGNSIDIHLNTKVMNLYQTIRQEQWFGVKDLVPAYSSLTIYYDVVAIKSQTRGSTAFGVMKNKLQRLLSQPTSVEPLQARKLSIPVCYAPAYAADAAIMEKQTGLPFEEIIHVHTSRIYHVYMIGFLPGFPYMGEVDSRIAVPRKREPRLRTEAGSVGIAGLQTGIYPLASPGGWQIIGRTPVKLFDKEQEYPALFRAGDEVSFYSIEAHEFDHY